LKSFRKCASTITPDTAAAVQDISSMHHAEPTDLMVPADVKALASNTKNQVMSVKVIKEKNRKMIGMSIGKLIRIITGLVIQNKGDWRHEWSPETSRTSNKFFRV
jgi:hypothetical protein